MSARAKAKKVQGVVVDGRVRDLSEHRSMEYPVSFFFLDTQYHHPMDTCDDPTRIGIYLPYSCIQLGVCQVAFHATTKRFREAIRTPSTDIHVNISSDSKPRRHYCGRFGWCHLRAG